MYSVLAISSVGGAAACCEGKKRRATDQPQNQQFLEHFQAFRMCRELRVWKGPAETGFALQEE
jgi:hypothetical protein